MHYELRKNNIVVKALSKLSEPEFTDYTTIALSLFVLVLNIL